MPLSRYICLLLLLFSCATSTSQVKTFQASRIAHSPRIDGDISDAVWKDVPWLSGFVQNFPRYGVPVSQRTEVKIAYDDNGIYVAAYMYDDPSQIRKQITPRDGEQQTDVDYFSVFFDTYNDHQNGFQFLVTSENVQTDARLGPNLGGDQGSLGDKTWDAVWESRVNIREDGWTVEMRIPYLSLRFSKDEFQTWGVQFLRFIRRNNESSYWNPVNPEVNGFVNQFGEMSGLRKIQPPLRLSFSPYITTGYRRSPVNNTYLNEWLRNGGMDVKYGINESFTLDATLIPDFGQVVSDNVINNLSPYEIRFQENRPFFTEGTELFNKAGLFYSRRVGAVPGGYYDVRQQVDADPDLQIIKNPSLTQLYNGVKFSGRTKNKLGIGVFNAITAPMNAVIRNTVTNDETRILTEPLANYNIVVLDQALKDRSYLTFTNTNVIRSGNGRDANVTALDAAIYDKNNRYGVIGTVRYSKIWDSSPSDGYNTQLRVGKVSGNWQYSVQGNVESKNYDPNDLGILPAANEISYRANVTYRQFVPTKNFITYSYSLTSRLQYLYEPYAYNKVDLTATGFWIFRNFWDVQLTTNFIPGWERNYFELRTDNRFIRYPTNYLADLSGSTDSRKKLFVRFGGTYAIAPEYDNVYTGISLGMRYRFSNRFSFDIQSDAHNETNQLGFAFERELNGEPIAGFRDNRDFTSVISGIYNFTSRLNLTLRARHYWNRVTYTGFRNVDNQGYLINRAFINGKDENVNIFNVDAFVTWDFRLGSRLIVGYKNWLGDEETILVTGKNNYLRNLGQVFNRRHGNELTVRFIYFIDYNQFRNKL